MIAENMGRIHKIIGFLSIQKILSLWVLSIMSWMVSISPILRSSWSGDDWPSSQAPYWIQWRSGSLKFSEVVLDSIFYTRAWMFGQGRFYPFAYLENRIQFSYLQELWQYKLFQFLLLSVTGLAFSFLIFRLSQSHFLAVGVLFTLSITVQFRTGFDPHLAFSSLLSSMLLKVFIAAIIINSVARTSKSKNSRKYSYLSSLIFFSAMGTYELSFFLFPILLIAFYIGTERIQKNGQKFTILAWIDRALMSMFDKRFRPVLYAWLLYAFFVFGILRSIARDISGAYVFGLSDKSIPVFFSQLPTGIPFVSFKLEEIKTFSLHIFVPMLFLMFVLIVVTIKNNIKTLQQDLVKVEKNSRSQLFAICLILNLPAGIVMSLQEIWWDKATVTNSYLGVILNEFAIALLIILCLEQIFNKLYPQRLTL